MGAAIQGGTLEGSLISGNANGMSSSGAGQEILLLDVTPLSLGIETLGGVCTRLIERNTTLPITKSQIFSTAANFQTSVEINVLQGERPMASQNKSLGKFKLNGIRRAMRGVPQIEVTFSIDANGIVNVSAKDLETGKRQEISIQGSSNMSREEVDRAIREAQQYAAEDARAKDEATAKDTLEQLIFQAESGKKQLDKERRKELDEAVKRAKRAIRQKDVQEMQRCTAELESMIPHENQA